MIQITCTSCKNVLRIDDAFAGGVCRCQHCGTIQTVPARVKAGASQVEAAAAGKSSKLLYQNKARSDLATASGSGLEDLAGIVASSGLSDSRLRKPTQVNSDLQKNLVILLAVGGGIVVLLAIVILYLVFRGGPAKVEQPQPSQQLPPTAFSPAGPGQVVDSDKGPAPKPAVVRHDGPNCLGIKLTSDSVVYLIDDGSASSSTLDYIKYAVYRSIDSLGPQKQFTILFWKPDSASYGPATATPEHLTEAKSKVEDVIAFQSSEPMAGFKKAIAANPGEIVIFSAKWADFEESTGSAILAARGNSSVKIHVIDVGGNKDDAAAVEITTKTGGAFLPISDSDLKAN